MNPRTSRDASTPPTTAAKPATSPAPLAPFAPAIRAACRATAILDDVVLELDEHDLPRERAALEDVRVAVLECCAPTLDALRIVDPERAGAVERLVVGLSRAIRNLQARNGAIGARVNLVHVEVQPFDFLQFDELRTALVALRTELEAALLEFPDRVELHALRTAAPGSSTSDAPASTTAPEHAPAALDAKSLVLSAFLRDPSLSDREIAAATGVSHTTVWRVLRRPRQAVRRGSPAAEARQARRAI